MRFIIINKSVSVASQEFYWAVVGSIHIYADTYTSQNTQGLV